MTANKSVRIIFAWFKITGGSDAILQQKTTETITCRQLWDKWQTIKNIITSFLPEDWWLGVIMEIWARQNVLLSNKSGN